MLLGQMPGDTLSGSPTLFAALPSYATIIGQYLDRFGPYRLQPYAMPALPQFSPPASVPVPAPPLVTQPVAAAPVNAFARGREARGRDLDTVREPFDPVGAGLGVLTGYDRAIGFLDRFADPMDTRLGFSNLSPTGAIALGLRELTEATKQDAINRINDARLKGLINDANRRVAPGTPVGRGGGLGSPGVGPGVPSSAVGRPVGTSIGRSGGIGSPSGRTGIANGPSAKSVGKTGGKAASGSGSSGRPAERPSPDRSSDTRGSKFGRDSRSFGH
jgi:hypothetical protein